jgi:hypothetical protein
VTGLLAVKDISEYGADRESWNEKKSACAHARTRAWGLIRFTDRRCVRALNRNADFHAVTNEDGDAAKLHPPPKLLDRHGNLNPEFIDNLHFRLALVQEQQIAALERADNDSRPDPIGEALRKVELYRKIVDLRHAMHKEQLMWSRMKRKKKRS